jgi:hypothetical protein
MVRRLSLSAGFIQRLATVARATPHGTRNAILIGALLGLAWAIPGRLWMRLITDREPVFTVGGTLFIFIVVSGFGAAAGYAFAVRGRPRRRIRRWLERGLAFLPFAGMGPGLIFFFPGVPLALAAAHRGWRRRWRIALASFGGVAASFWTLVMLSNAPGLLTAALYLALGYVLYASLRFAIERTEPKSFPPYDPYAAGDVGASPAG